MKDNNYIVIQGWMINRLNLSGNRLLLYAIVYGFSQNGESSFTGSINYIANLLSCSRPTVIKTMSELIDLGLVKKHTENENGVSFNSYKCVFEDENETPEGSKETLLGSKETLLGGSKETLLGGSKEILPNKYNIYSLDNNINNNIAISEVHHIA